MPRPTGERPLTGAVGRALARLACGAWLLLAGCHDGDSGSTAVTGALISDACTPIASWNFDPAITTGAFGAVSVAESATRAGLAVTFVDGAKHDISPGGGRSLQVVVADEAIARIHTSPGAPDEFSIEGRRPGKTNLEIRIVFRGRVEYRSGSIPVLVFGAPENPKPAFLMRKNGIWCVLVRDGELVGDECGRAADPGRLETAVGETSEHYFFRRFDGGCTQVNLAGPDYHFTYEFTDDCIARFIIGDHEPNLLTFHLEGLVEGDTGVRFHFFRHDTLEFSSPLIPVHVNAAFPPQ